LNTGDNYYYPGGRSRLPNTAWEVHWKKVYHKSEFLKNLNWYGVLGNHDYNNIGLETYFENKVP